jgi:trans-aconitate methyltransferase
VQPLLYSELVPWYRLIDPPEDHADEAAAYRAAFERALPPGLATLLDLGAGGGHNAFHLKRRFACTLTDLSPDMLESSRELNPECEHAQGDMRTLRLDRLFDAVLVHDAVAYMTTEADLLAAVLTAFVHTRSGGAAVFAPDCYKDTFQEGTDLLEATRDARAIRGLSWAWDPDPKDDVMAVDYAFLLRDGATLRAVHDHHDEGLFSKATWVRLLTSVGYDVEAFPRPLDDDGAFDEVFLCRKPER